MSGDLGFEVSDALAAGCDSLEAVAARLGLPVLEVDVAVRRSIAGGLVVGWQHPDRVELRLTQAGANEVRIRHGLEQGVIAPGAPDLSGFVTQISQAWSAGQAAEAQRQEAAQAHMLVGDAERDSALRTISDAYAENRIDMAEVDRRTALALSANTRGDLAAALDDLPRQASATTETALARWTSSFETAGKLLVAVVTVTAVVGVLLAVLVTR